MRRIPSPLRHSIQGLLLLLTLVCASMTAGALGGWHLHAFDGIELFHSHSNLGAHHHQELHAEEHRQARPYGPTLGAQRHPGGSPDPPDPLSDDRPLEPACGFTSLSLASAAPLAASAATAPMRVVEPLLAPFEEASRAGATATPLRSRAPPA